MPLATRSPDTLRGTGTVARTEGIVLREGPLRALTVFALALAICAVTVQDATAESNMDLKAIGGNLGLVSPEDIDETIGFGVFADWGSFAPSWQLGSSLDFWSKSEDLGFGNGEVSIRDISLTTRAKYLFAVSSPKFQPYVGGGLGLHFIRGEVTIPDEDLGGGFIIPGMTVSDTQTELGLDLGGGFRTPLGAQTELAGDLWYSIVDDFSQLSLKVGVAYRL
jgi:opacity protein-like surface antigen